MFYFSGGNCFQHGTSNNLYQFLPGKSITTSVPSFAIRFHAEDEELEEIYPSADETDDDAEKQGVIPCIKTKSVDISVNHFYKYLQST